MLSDGLKGSYPNMGTQKSLPPNGILLYSGISSVIHSILPVVLAKANTKAKSIEVPL